MWSAVIPATSWALLWLLLPTLAFVQLDRTAVGARWRAWLAGRQRPLLFVLLLALGVRLVPMLLLPVGAAYDIESFRLVGEALLNGEDVYTSQAFGRHPYLPFQMYWLGAALAAARMTSLPFVIWIKLPAVLADVAITALLYLSIRRARVERTPFAYNVADIPQTAVTLACFYALNPLPILISAYHGQFDAITLLLLLLSWYFWHFGRRLVPSAFALGFAVLSKTWPLIFLPLVVMRLPNRRMRLLYTSISLAIPGLLVLLYLVGFAGAPMPMLRRALTHTGVPGYWGFSALLSVLGTWSQPAAQLYDWLSTVPQQLLLLMALLTLWWTRRQSALDALVTVLLGAFAVTVGIGIQWLIWVLPFALLAGEPRWQKVYSLAALPIMLAQLYGLHLYPWAYELLGREVGTLLIKLASLPAWIVVLAWFAQRVTAVRYSYAGAVND